MRAVLLSLMFASALHAAEPMCGSTPANDRRVNAIHARTQARLATNAVSATREATLREGAFYVKNDATITPGHRAFDLLGKSLVFTPAGGNAYTMRTDALRYVAPKGAPLKDFANGTTDTWWYVAHELPFAFPLFGTNVTRIYVDAYNGIATSVPPQQGGTQFDAIEASVRRGPLLSPLMLPMTGRAPRPQVWIENKSDGVVITWRSGNTTSPFGYDLQAKLAKNGTITYSYRTMTAMHWGAPIVSPGLDPLTIARTPIHGANDAANDVSSSVPEALRPMLDIQRVDVQRLGDADLFAVRLTLGAPIDREQISIGQPLEYEVRLSGLEVAGVRVDRYWTEVISFTGYQWDFDGASAFVDGNVVEIYGVQSSAETRTVRAASGFASDRADALSFDVPFPTPPRSIVTDLSAVPQNARLEVPFAEPFVLGTFDPYAAWNVVQTSYGLSDHDYDAVAMYQSFFTDLIFHAGAYATGGNPQVDGIRPFMPVYGTHASKAPTLLHMNQLTYGWSAKEQTAAQVLLHEFGHRWLSFFTITENGSLSSAVNPTGAHPAAYVHTAAAFPVYGERESSVMGGAYFTQQGDGSWIARAANNGYSWSDLYLMGLAAPEEVPPWFYLAGTTLPLSYWPPDGIVVTGDPHTVTVPQITAVHGPRTPSSALSQREFRVLFVLVTDATPTAAEVATVNQWRHVMERNFLLATGGRGRLITTFTRGGRRRAV